MFVFLLRFCIFFIGILHLSSALADPAIPSIGQFAFEMKEHVGIIRKFFDAGAIILGLMFLFASFLRYMEFRINRIASPLSTVIALLVLGLILLSLPFLHEIYAYFPFHSHV